MDCGCHTNDTFFQIIEVSDDNTAISLPNVIVEIPQNNKVFHTAADHCAGTDIESTCDVDSALPVNTIDNDSDITGTTDTAFHSVGIEIESIQIVDSPLPVCLALDKTRLIDFAEADMKEADLHCHESPTLLVIEIKDTFHYADDQGASASTEHYNDFERFLAEDRMWGMHAPDERVNKQTTTNKKTKDQAKEIAVNKLKASIHNLKDLVEVNKSADVNAAKVHVPSNPAGAIDKCIPSDTDTDLPARTRKLSTE